MNITNKEFETIKKALELLPHGLDFENLPKETQDTIVRADTTMVNLLQKKKKSNKRTAEYIANKRKENKNYAR